jgi:hypothetical protein
MVRNIIKKVKSSSRSNSKYFIPSVSHSRIQILENQLHKNIIHPVKNKKYFYKNTIFEEKLLDDHNYESNIYTNNRSFIEKVEEDDESRYSLIDKLRGAFNQVKQKISDKSQSVKEYFKTLKYNDSSKYYKII